jgi:hypothetical protein
MTTRRGLRAPAIAVVGLVLSALLVLPFGSERQVGADAAAEQREVKRQRAALAGQIDALEATDAEVSAALAALDANVRSTRAQLADAQAAVDAAEARAQEAEEQARATEARIGELRGAVVRAAVDAYVRPDGEGSLDAFRESSANEAVTREKMLDVANGNKLDAVEELRTAQRELEDQRDAAEAARAEAETRRQGLAEKISGYEAAQAEQQRVAADVGDRLDAKLAESQSLAALDAQLAKKIADEQAALAAQVAAARRAASSSGNGGSGGGGGGGGGGPVTVIPRPDGLTTVRGITVAGAIAGNLASLLEAASAAGINLTGSGWRDSAAQVALRMQHCGTSNYAIYEMPPDSCRPPTAIPGRSKHEKGLAVDFGVNGRAIQSRSDPAFQWLAANAGRFGFANLPSEPWHWSNDGT